MKPQPQLASGSAYFLDTMLANIRLGTQERWSPHSPVDNISWMFSIVGVAEKMNWGTE